MKDSARRIDFLDYVRGIAILSVFLYHALITAYGHNALPWERLFRGFSVLPSFIALLPLHLGWMGVPVFFVVSGFCIHVSFQQQGREWDSFYIRRFFRLYPAYLAALVLFLWLNVDKVHDLGAQFVWHALLIHNFNPQMYYGLNASFWTIAIEVQLYLLYPLLLALVAKFGWKSALLFLATGECFIHGWEGIRQAMLGASGYQYPVMFNKLLPYYNIVDAPSLAFLNASPLAYWFSWSLGASAADAFLKKQPMPLVKSSLPLWVFLVVAAYFARPLFPFCFMFSAVLTTAVISKYLSAGRAEHRPPNFWREWLRHIGIYSYSIYLLHQPLVGIFASHLTRWLPGIQPLGKLLCCISFGVVIFLLAAGWYRFIEVPGVTFGKKIIQKIAAKRSLSKNCPGAA